MDRALPGSSNRSLVNAQHRTRSVQPFRHHATFQGHRTPRLPQHRPATCGTQKLTAADGTPVKRENWLSLLVARFGSARRGGSGGAVAAEAAVLEAISGVEGRGSKGLAPEQLAAFEAAVEVLEADGGVKAPTASPQLEGRWRLLYTSKPGTASPIQRTFTGIDAFSIFQDITLETDDIPTIVNVVEFGSVGVLRVEAEANTDRQPLPGFTPRQGAGIPLFGKSSTYPPSGPDIRVDFQFSKGTFAFNFLPFTIPYPVPFKALGDETKGFIDVTYMSPEADGLRLSRGNKGTLFVLQKEGPVPDPGEFKRRSAGAASENESAATKPLRAAAQSPAAAAFAASSPAAHASAAGRKLRRGMQQDAAAAAAGKSGVACVDETARGRQQGLQLGIA